VDEIALNATMAWPTARLHGVKILGTGDLKKKLTVIAQRVQRIGASAKIEAKGGTCEVLSLKPARLPAKA
jgi:ribosomal protein L15